jgi:hypothetical protein
MKLSGNKKIVTVCGSVGYEKTIKNWDRQLVVLEL